MFSEPQQCSHLLAAKELGTPHTAVIVFSYPMMPRGHGGAAFSMERRIAGRLGLSSYPCACQRCRGGRRNSVSVVAMHHRRYDREPYLRYPVLVNMNLFHGFMSTGQTSFKQVVVHPNFVREYWDTRITLE